MRSLDSARKLATLGMTRVLWCSLRDDGEAGLLRDDGEAGLLRDDRGLGLPWDDERVALRQLSGALGASRDVIMADYELSRDAVGAYPTSLAATLDELARRGGVDAYYAELGVTADELAFLREYATAP